MGFSIGAQPPMPRLKERYSKLMPSQYFELVKSYGQRQLSYSSDALNAFSGILTALTAISSHQFLWGMMQFQFERQLHWFGDAELRRGLGLNEFPIWSWVSWEGELLFEHYLRYDPVIRCWMIREVDDNHEFVTVSDSSQSASSDSGNDWTASHPTISTRDVVRLCPVSFLQANFHLFFWTYSATLYLIPQGRLVIPDQKPRYNFDSSGRVIGPKPDYGYLIPSLPESELCDKGYRECILIGRKPPLSKWDVPHVIVMMISRNDGIARRIGIADLPEDFWNLVDKRWELITLG